MKPDGAAFPWTLKRFIDERAALTHPSAARPDLPVWHLGSIGVLHRRDIYDATP
jgi:hypothetical protein